MKIETSNPTEWGKYAALTVTGWRILEWCNGSWWFEGQYASFRGGAIRAHIGPLPETVAPPAMEFDL